MTRAENGLLLGVLVLPLALAMLAGFVYACRLADWIRTTLL